MARLEPITTRLIQPDWAPRVPSPAHDTLAPAERRRYVADNPDTFLRVTRGPEDVEPGREWDSAQAVRDSQAALERLLRHGAYSELAPPALYLYRLSIDGVTGPHAQIGIVGNIAVDDYERGVIRVHELVQEQRARHLADHLTALEIQSSPIALAHRADPALSSLVATIADTEEPVLDFVAPDGLRQQVWQVEDHERIRAMQAALAASPLYLIDGHHRAAAAAHHRSRRPNAGADWMLSAIFPADELRNEAFHRLMHHVDQQALLDMVSRRFPIQSDVDIEEVFARSPDQLALLTGSIWHLVDLGPLPDGDSLSRLDAVRLEREILGPLFDLRTTDPGDRLTYRVGDPDRVELATWTTAADQALWLMRPVPMATVLDAADAGTVMPPKSTFFQPKARSGVFLRPQV